MNARAEPGGGGLLARAEATRVEPPYVAWAFGGDDTPELATELGLPLRDGPKRGVWPAPR